MDFNIPLTEPRLSFLHHGQEQQRASRTGYVLLTVRTSDPALCSLLLSGLGSHPHPHLLAKAARLASEVGPVMSQWGGSGDRGLWRFSLLILGTDAGLLSWESEKPQ